MPIMPDGFNTYTTKDGKWAPLEPENLGMSLSVEGRRVFSYDQETGVLNLNEASFPVGTLESIAEEIKAGNEVGVRLPLQQGSVRLRGLKEVRYFTPEELVSEDRPTPSQSTNPYTE